MSDEGATFIPDVLTEMELEEAELARFRAHLTSGQLERRRAAEVPACMRGRRTPSRFSYRLIES